MGEFLIEYGLFLAKTVTVVLALLVLLAAALGLSQRGQGGRSKERLEVKHLNRRYADMATSLRAAMASKKEQKALRKERKKTAKQAQKTPPQKPKLFVLNFNGDLRASAVTALREEISALLSVAGPDDEVLLRLESPGGLVNAYGLAASQLTRIKSKPLKLTVAVDKVAASGGYMMACVGDRIIAAPFAVLGSIGVLAQVPNLHRLLKKNDIDFEQFTAGQYKRTVTVFGENTDQDREKFQQDIDQTHELFKQFVKQQRPALDVERVATGEIWYGTQALAEQLVDELRTSDDYLLQASERAELYEVTFKSKKPMLARLLGGVDQDAGRVLAGRALAGRALTKLLRQRLP